MIINYRYDARSKSWKNSKIILDGKKINQKIIIWKELKLTNLENEAKTWEVEQNLEETTKHLEKLKATPKQEEIEKVETNNNK